MSFTSASNRVSLIGNIGSIATLTPIKDNTGSVLNLTLATNEYYGKGDNKKKVTDWHNLVAWNKTAELLNKLVKVGDKVMIEGKLKNDNYEKDGVKVYTTKIEVVAFQIITNNSPEDDSND